MQKEDDDVELTKYLKGTPANKFIRPLFYQRVSKACSERTGLFLKVLNRPKINLVYLKSISFRGIPSECKGLRGIVWRLLLEHLPPETSSWEKFLQTRKEEYEQLRLGFKIPKVPRLVPGLGQVLTSDEELAKEIKIDIKRTKRDVVFFGKLANATAEAVEEKKTIEKEDDTFLYGEVETNRQILSRMLYVFCKRDTSNAYVQGMNELIATLYYCFAKNSEDEFSAYLESDTYFCFTHLMHDLKDTYARQSDKTLSGLNTITQKISEIVKRIDPDYWTYLTDCKADIQLFALRWIMLLFAQDLELDRVIRLWDALLGDPERFLFLQYFVAQIVIDAKKVVVGSEFYIFVKVVQNTPREINLAETLMRAGNMLAKDQKKDHYIGEHYY